jgi:glutaminase
LNLPVRKKEKGRRLTSAHTPSATSRRQFLQSTGKAALLSPALLIAPTVLARTANTATNLQALVNETYVRYKDVRDGNNANYIPYLATIPTHLFGIAIATPDGQCFTAGDTQHQFPIESISKLFTAALVMQESGPEVLKQKIGAEATGLPFNAAMAVELHEGKPLNPFVNAGAIATASLVTANTPQQRWDKIRNNMHRFAERSLSFNEAVYTSESTTNTHNRAIAWLLQSYGYMYSDPEQALDIYTKQCSVNIHTTDLATMGSVLINQGVHPVTGTPLINKDYLPFLLAEMATSGMYDASGTWMYEVGIPAKSGVGGGLLAISPGRYAIAAFSPPLDQFGNSVRAQLAIRHIARTLQLNIYL